MKRKLLLTAFVLTGFLTLALPQDEIIYTVQGRLDNQPIPIDSIYIENLQNRTELVIKDFHDQDVYTINLTTGEVQNPVGIENLYIDNLFSIERNTPGNLDIRIKTKLRDEAIVSVYNTLGQLVYISDGLNINQNSILKVKLPGEGFYLVNISTSMGRKSFKARGANSYGFVSLSSSGYTNENEVNDLKSSKFKSSDFSFQKGDSLRISAFHEGYYVRPIIKVLSESENIVFNFALSNVEANGVSDVYVSDTTYEVLNYSVDSGAVTVNPKNEEDSIYLGDILTIDLDTAGFIRKVTGVLTNPDGTILLETEQATMNELFINKSFTLNTELIEPSPSVRMKSSGSRADISRALTDENGHIHPVKLIYHYKTGNKIKSTLSSNATDDAVVPLFDVTEDFSNTTIFQNGNVHFYIDQGYSKLNGNAIFYFFFEEGAVIDPKTKIRKGDLVSFSYNMKNTYDFKTNLKLEFKDSYSSENHKKLLKPKSVTAKFLVGAIPVWITFNLSVHGKYNISADASVTTQWGFQNKISANTGAAFSAESDYFVQNKPVWTESKKIDPLKVEGKFNLDARLEIYPRIEAMLYSFVGPFVELVPYTTGKVEAKGIVTSDASQDYWAWNSNVAAGFDTRVGAKLDFAGIFEDEEFGPVEKNLYNTIIWEAPEKIEIVSGNEQAGETNTTLAEPVVVMVTDNMGNPLSFVSVIFDATEGNGSAAPEAVLTDEKGLARSYWTLGEQEGEQQLTAMVKKPDETEIKAEPFLAVASAASIWYQGCWKEPDIDIEYHLTETTISSNRTFQQDLKFEIVSDTLVITFEQDVGLARDRCEIKLVYNEESDTMIGTKSYTRIKGRGGSNYSVEITMIRCD